MDLNLQFPANWEEAKRIKYAQGFNKPAPRDYVGEGPLTEPEALALYNFTLAHNPKLTISYHTQGEVIFWQYLDYKPTNALEIATKFSELSGYNIEEVPLNSAILNTTYNKINLNNCNSLLSRFYSDSLNVEDLTLEEKLGVAINNLNNGECAANFSVSFDALNEAFVNLFNDSNLITNYQVAGETTYGNYLVNYDDVNRMFYINENACVTCDNNYLVKTISRATTDGDNLYIYESFGYFKYIDSNNYEVYDSPNETKLLTTFVDTDGTKNFTNNDILANYMWTYKKGTNNNYYFVSVTRL